ncbi:MAG: hypothetical protein AAGJ29_11480 [Pseudomonadota bacterium]
MFGQTVFSRRTILFGASTLLMSAIMPASGAIEDVAHFNVLGMVVVWGADGFDATGQAPVVSDFVIDSNPAGGLDADLITDDVFTVVTGTLTATQNATASTNGVPFRVQRVQGGAFTTDFDNDGVLTAADTFDPFTIRGNSDINTRRGELFTSFYVASNVPFNIEGQARPLGTTDADAFNRMRLQLRVTQTGDDGLAFGSAAQFPHTAGAAGGSRANNRRLSTMATPIDVFRGNQRTARIRGTLSEQSVRFDLRYRYNSGNIDLADGVIDASAEVIYTIYVP